MEIAKFSQSQRRQCKNNTILDSFSCPLVMMLPTPTGSSGGGGVMLRMYGRYPGWESGPSPCVVLLKCHWLIGNVTDGPSPAPGGGGWQPLECHSLQLSHLDVNRGNWGPLTPTTGLPTNLIYLPFLGDLYKCMKNEYTLLCCFDVKL